MPLFLEFKSRMKDIKADSRETKDLVPLILRIPSLTHQGAKDIISVDQEGNVRAIKLEVKGIAVIDEESAHMLHAVISRQLTDADSPYYLSFHAVSENVLPGEALFLHERFKPLKSQNSRVIARIPGLEIPERFCCPLSGDIIDEPIYDVRSPGIMYDQLFLMYWLDKSFPRLMPHTKLPFREEFLEVDYALKLEINGFIQSKVDEFKHNSLCKILEKYGIPPSQDQSILNRALILISACDDEVVFRNELSILLKFGANINFQDQERGGQTVLHFLLMTGKVGWVVGMLYCGAKIHLANVRGITAFDIIKDLPAESLDRGKLIYVAKKLGLISVSTSGQLMLSTKITPLPVTENTSGAHRQIAEIKSDPQSSSAAMQRYGSQAVATRDAHLNFVQRIDALIIKDANPLMFDPFVTSIREFKYSQALRRACSSKEIKRVLPIIEILLEFKEMFNININEKTGAEGFTALHHAARKAAVHGDRTIYDLLVNNGAREDLVDASGATPISYLTKSISSQDNKTEVNRTSSLPSPARMLSVSLPAAITNPIIANTSSSNGLIEDALALLEMQREDVASIGLKAIL